VAATRLEEEEEGCIQKEAIHYKLCCSLVLVKVNASQGSRTGLSLSTTAAL